MSLPEKQLTQKYKRLYFCVLTSIIMINRAIPFEKRTFLFHNAQYARLKAKPG